MVPKLKLTAAGTRSFFKSILQGFHENDVKFARKTKRNATIFKPEVNLNNLELDEDEQNSVNELLNLQEVEQNLNEGIYDNNQWLFIKDVTLAFKFIIDYCSPSSYIHKKAKELLNHFENEMDAWMRDVGYCCGRYRIVKSKIIACSFKNTCFVKDKQKFYRYDEYTFCSDHFRELMEKYEEILINDNLKLPPSVFVDYTFKEVEREKYVVCFTCKKIFHERCVLFLCDSYCAFYCENCRFPLDVRFLKYTARALKPTECDIFINNYLYSKIDLKDINITIRMLSSMKKIFRVERALDPYRNEPSKIGYTNSTIFAFYEDEDGYDLCFFSMIIQLYDNTAPKANRNTAYIGYIDSVKLLPTGIRTPIYQFILLGLFEYLKKKGYEKIFIWSCPPNPNDDYIFQSKPYDQKTPNAQHLSKWYRDLIDKGMELKIVEAVEGSESYSFHTDWRCVDNIPLMEGDLWTVRLAEAVLTAETEAIKKKANEKRAETAQFVDKQERIWELMQVQTKGFDQSYFVLFLKDPQDPLAFTNRAENHDVNVCKDMEKVHSPWINNRHVLVDFFANFKLTFKNLRETRFATFVILQRIYTETNICRICSNQLKLNPYLLCDSCYRTTSAFVRVKKVKRGDARMK